MEASQYNIIIRNSSVIGNTNTIVRESEVLTQGRIESSIAIVGITVNKKLPIFRSAKENASRTIGLTFVGPRLYEIRKRIASARGVGQIILSNNNSVVSSWISIILPIRQSSKKK